MSNRTFRLSERRKNAYSFHNSLLSKVTAPMSPLAGLGEGGVRGNSVCHTPQTGTHGSPSTPHTHTYTG